MVDRLTASGRTVLPWYAERVSYSPATLALNWPWQNVNGSETVNYLASGYNSASIEAALTQIASWGIKTIRAWTPLESVMSWNGSAFAMNSTNAGNLDDFLTRAANHGLQVIAVMGDGQSSGGYTSLDGKFRWTFVTGSDAAYLTALAAYLTRFTAHTNIAMWELQNEPYANLTFSANAVASGATQTQLHTFLKACYTAAKAIAGNTYVGFSDYEEEQQTEYQMFSNPTNLANLVNDCTDVYSMHIYRADQSQIADFRTLTGKPKWCSEVGSYNYYDPTASEHPIAAYDELDSDGPNGISGLSNPYSTRSIAAQLMNSGFSLIAPWAYSDNPGFVLNAPDGTVLPGSLPLWMADQFTTTRSLAISRLPVTPPNPAPYPVQHPAHPGSTITLTPVGGTDQAPTGPDVALLVYNGSASPVGLFVPVVRTYDGLAVSPREMTVPAGGLGLLPLLPDEGGLAAITYTATDQVSAAVIAAL